ncbi:MAG: thermonuclease family protein [bacterium]
MKSFIFILIIVAAVQSRNVKVETVYSGDSMKTSKNERVKLLGVSCPKIDEPYGREALAFTISMLKGRLINLQFDSGVERRDSSGTILSYAFLVCDTCEGASFEDGTGRKDVISIKAPLVDVCKELLQRGLVRVDTTVACGKLKFFNYLQKTAMHNKKGMWENTK